MGGAAWAAVAVRSKRLLVCRKSARRLLLEVKVRVESSSDSANRFVPVLLLPMDKIGNEKDSITTEPCRIRKRTVTTIRGSFLSSLFVAMLQKGTLDAKIINWEETTDTLPTCRCCMYAVRLPSSGVCFETESKKQRPDVFLMEWKAEGEVSKFQLARDLSSSHVAHP
jgi:hypothetical protein